MKLVWSHQSRLDAQEAVAYLNYNSPNAAKKWYYKIQETCEKLKQFPRIGRVVPEFNQENIREIFYRDYRIIYKIIGQTVRIATIRHGKIPIKQSDV